MCSGIGGIEGSQSAETTLASEAINQVSMTDTTPLSSVEERVSTEILTITTAKDQASTSLSTTTMTTTLPTTTTTTLKPKVNRLFYITIDLS